MAAALTTTDPVPVMPPVTPRDCSAVKGYNWNTQIAYAICMAESRGDHLADNSGTNRDGSTDYGLMQINSIHADMVNGDLTALLDPATNIKIAYSLSRNGTDWTAWSAYNNGTYRKYL